MTKVILASASPRRRELLKNIIKEFSLFPSTVEERLRNESPSENAMRLAFEKARQVSGLFYGSLVIGADTLVSCDDEIFGKPKSRDDAVRILKALRGKEHEVTTGLAVIKGPYKVIDSAVSTVLFKELTDQDILSYIDTGEPEDKAGAYGIQGRGGDMVVSSHKGSFSNIVGLPVELLKDILQDKVFKNFLDRKYRAEDECSQPFIQDS